MKKLQEAWSKSDDTVKAVYAAEKAESQLVAELTVAESRVDSARSERKAAAWAWARAEATRSRSARKALEWADETEARAQAEEKRVEEARAKVVEARAKVVEARVKAEEAWEDAVSATWEYAR
jgi:hypothetical protein